MSAGRIALVLSLTLVLASLWITAPAATEDAPPPVTISPQAGMPRDWEAGVGVSPYSTVNLLNGNLITALSLVSWDPVGPPVHFTLYHNSAGAGSSSEEIDPSAGFSFGPGWSHSYAGAIQVNFAGTVATLIEDDGNLWQYTKNGNDWDAEPGKFDLLEWDAANSEWVLTRLDQSQRIFDDKGRLVRVVGRVGDLNGDGFTDLADLGILLADFGCAP